MIQMNKKRSIGNIKKLKEGKYKIRISAGYDDFGKRIVINKNISASSEREAEKILMQLYSERENVKTVSSPQTLKGMFDCFLLNHCSSLSANTVDYYKNLMKHFEAFYNLKIEKINITNINKIFNSMPEGKIKHGAFKLLKTVINKNKMWGFFKEVNPCELIPAPKYKAPEKNILSIEDINKINSFLIDEELKYQCIFYFAVLLGMRRGEIIGLKWSDINFNNNTILIQRAAALSHNSNDDYVITKEPKTASSVRVLPLPLILIEKLKKLKKEQNLNILKLGDLYHNNNFIFTTWNGHIMNIHTPTNWWREFVDKHNLSRVTLHGLRHTCCSLMLKEGNDLTSISKTLGHSNLSTTLNIYSHMIEDNKKAAIDSVASYFEAK